MKSAYFFALAIACAEGCLSMPALVSSAHAAEESKPALHVVMYATETCTYCVKARAWFESQSIAWEERDIDASAAANKEWRELGGVGTPLILVNGKRFHGFAQNRLEAEISSYRW